MQLSVLFIYLVSLTKRNIIIAAKLNDNLSDKFNTVFSYKLSIKIIT